MWVLHKCPPYIRETEARRVGRTYAKGKRQGMKDSCNPESVLGLALQLRHCLDLPSIRRHVNNASNLLQRAKEDVKNAWVVRGHEDSGGHKEP